jgi:hypothetical protein
VADVDMVCTGEVVAKVVEVVEMFHPVPDPVASPTLNGSVTVTVWS